MSRFLTDVLEASLGGRTVLSDEELHVQDGIENRARPSVMLFMGLAVVLGVSAGLLKGLVGGEPGVKPNAWLWEFLLRALRRCFCIENSRTRRVVSLFYRLLR